jgi:hypothetical protein
MTKTMTEPGRTFDNADDLIRDLFSKHTKKDLIEIIVAQTQAAVDAETRATPHVERLARFYHDTRDEGECYHPGGDATNECVAFAAEFAYPELGR